MISDDQSHDLISFSFSINDLLWCFCSYIYGHLCLFFYPSSHSIVEKRKNTKDNSRKGERKTNPTLISFYLYLSSWKKKQEVSSYFAGCSSLPHHFWSTSSSLNLSFFEAPTSPLCSTRKYTSPRSSSLFSYFIIPFNPKKLFNYYK